MTIKTAGSDKDDINNRIEGAWVWNDAGVLKLVLLTRKHDGTTINRFIVLS